MAIHQDLSNKSSAELVAMVMAMQDKLAAKRNQKLTLKVSAKGAVSVYGMGRWPVTLYGEQWTRLLDSADEIRSFVADNADALSVKE